MEDLAFPQVQENTKFAQRIYILSYLTQSSFSMLKSLFITLFFSNFLGFSLNQTAQIYIFGYLPMLMKPMFGYLMAKVSIHHSNRKIYVITGASLMACSLLIIGLNFNPRLYWISVLFYFFAHLGQVLTDVGTDAIALDREQGNSFKATANMRWASIVGSTLIQTLYISFFWGNLSQTAWIFLFGAIALLNLPIIFNALKYHENLSSSPSSLDLSIEERNFDKSSSSFYDLELRVGPAQARKFRLLMLIFCITGNIYQLSDYFLEVHYDSTFGSDFFGLYIIVFTISLLLSLPFLGLFYRYRENLMDKRNWLIIVSGCYTILFLLVNITENLTLLLVTICFGGFFGTLNSFCFVSLLIDITPRKNRSFVYQFYSFVFVLSYGAFPSIGLVLYDSFGAKWTFIINILMILVNIPVLLPIKIPKSGELPKSS